MKRCTLPLAALVCLIPSILLARGGSFSTPIQPSDASPFSVGEKLTFRIDWNPPWFLFLLPTMEVGEVRLHLAGETEFEGKRAYKIIFEAHSSGTLAKLAGITVDDRYEFLTHPETFCTFRADKREQEGKRKRDITVVYFPAERKLHFHELDTAFSPPKVKRDQFVEKIPECVQDLFSALYAMRKEKLELGASHRALVGDNDKVKEVEARVEESETVETPRGKYRTWKIDTIALLGGLFREGGQMHFWLTADAKKIPVQFEVKVRLGKVTGKLKDAAF